MFGKFQHISEFNYHLQDLIRKKLWAKVIAGMVLGIGIGFLLGPGVGWVKPEVADNLTHWLALPGQLFLSLIKMIIIPLVVASIIVGITSSGSMQLLKKVGGYIFLYFFLTTGIAITIGLGVSYLIKPGEYITLSEQEKAVMTQELNEQEPAEAIDIQRIPENIINLIPDNPLSAMASGELLSVVVFTIIFGIALLAMNPAVADPIIKLLNSLQEVCITIVGWAMRLVPYAVFGLMTRLTSTTGFSTLAGLGVYMLTVLAGLLILLIVYMLIIALAGKQKPFKFLGKIKDLQLLAFSTSSSAAVMPQSMKVAQEQLGVTPFISKFVIPVGATVNMDGTALYQAVATVFLSQVFGLELSISNLILLIVTTIAASIGAPSAPGIGIVVLASVLQTVGIPPSGVALIIGVDRILDMTRTAVNVTGDMTAAVVFNRYLPEVDEE